MHPPGTIALPTGEVSRYGDFWWSLQGIRGPDDSRKMAKYGANVAENLNNIVREMHGEWVWLIGDDHTYEPDIILRLLDHHVDIVAPLVLRHAPPFQTVISTAPDPATGTHRTVVPLKQCRGLMPVHAVGTAGMLIRKRVFEALADPWFELGQIEPNQMSEDIWFCEKARRAGFEVYVDCDTTMTHMGSFKVYPHLEHGQWEIRLDLGNGCQVTMDPDTVMETFLHATQRKA